MRVGVIQSSYIPWRGYFDFIRSVDLFVFHDDLQYTKSDWRNRNRIKTPVGLKWITVPVHYPDTQQLIQDTLIDETKNWRRDHLNQFRANYGRAPYRLAALELLEGAFAQPVITISALNLQLISAICAYIGIETPRAISSAYSPSGAKTERLIDLLTKVGARTYVSGPAAKGYLEEPRFREAGIRLEYKTYDYAPYPQLWGPFEGAVSILDLIANCGPKARDYISSSTPNQVAIP